MPIHRHATNVQVEDGQKPIAKVDFDDAQDDILPVHRQCTATGRVAEERYMKTPLRSNFVNTQRTKPRLARVRVYVGIGLAAVALMMSFRAVALGQQRPSSAAQELSAVNAESRFPSATTCAPCHAEIYREWSVSAHAYAQMSPVFNAMQAKIMKLTNGTNGDFCIRCHTQVGMNLGEPEFLSNLDRNPTSREGVSCVICHRQDRAYS